MSVARKTGGRILPIAGVLALLAPLLAARIAWSPAGDGPLGWQCPMLEATGVPCPACGATRAFVHFVHGDAAFVEYNWAWLVIWAALLAWVALLVTRLARGKPLTGAQARRAGIFLQRRPAAAAVLPLGVLALPWLVALANASSIRAT